MKPLFVSLLFITLSALAAEKPNVLVIYSDDHGWADLGVQGVDKDVRTPHLDALAADGLRCTRGYVSAPQCVPSRAGVLTGRYQQRFALEDNTKGPLPLAERTLAERLKPAGYITGQVGKWHLDLRADHKTESKKDRSPLLEHMPHGQGFDEYWRGELSKFYASHDLAGKPFEKAPQIVPDQRFRVEVQTEAALSFLKRRESGAQPWFLYLAYFTPHVPLESPEPWLSQTPAHLPKERRQALAMIAAMDDGIGRMRAELKRQGQLEKTLIFFIGDNGAPTHEGHWNGSVNAPLVGEKGMLTDGGIRVPFLISWPSVLPMGKVYEQPVINLDVAATACTLAGQNCDGLDGVNLMPYLKGEKTEAPHAQLFWRWRSQAAVLEHPWKLIQLGAKERFLFNVTTPEGEKKNLLAEQPERAAKMEKDLAQWAQQLSPAGLPMEVHEQDLKFFVEHLGVESAAKEQKPKEVPGSVKGWLTRNGIIQQQAEGLSLKPAANAAGPVFLTHSQLDFLGPATLTLRCRAKVGGQGSVTWRIRHQADFEKGVRVTFPWPSGEQWTDVKVKLPPKSRLIHLRIHTPQAAQGLEVQSIGLEREGQPGESWDFRQQSQQQEKLETSQAGKVGPWDVQQLKSIVPKVRWLDQHQPVHSLLYEGQRYQQRDTEIFAHYASPITLGKVKQGRFPAVVCVHGGGGTAFAEWVQLWAERGYAAIAMDLGGMQPPAHGSGLNPHKPEGRQPLPNGGPAQSGEMKFGCIGGSHEDDWPYHTVANVIRAHSLIRSFSEVAAERTAITGISWGGYTTCLVASLDDRFKAAVPVYGCGFLRNGDSVQRSPIDALGERASLWVQTYDPGQYLKLCRVPILFVNGTHDIHYPLDSWTRSYDQVPGEKHTRVELKMAHSHPHGWAPREIADFIGSKCMNSAPLLKLGPVEAAPASISLSFTPQQAAREATLHFTSTQGLRSKREWSSLPAKVAPGRITTPPLPAGANTWYISVMDDQGRMVSTAPQFHQ